jgi:hypothetical protein
LQLVVPLTEAVIVFGTVSPGQHVWFPLLDEERRLLCILLDELSKLLGLLLILELDEEQIGVTSKQN